MKCFHLTISAIDKHELVAGFPYMAISRQRPSIVVGRTYKVGDIFKEWEEFKGDSHPCFRRIDSISRCCKPGPSHRLFR